MSALCHGCGTQIDEDEDVLCGNCKHDDAIRRECVQIIREWASVGTLLNNNVELLCAAILATEPAREES